jgi:hypothetical protein
MKVIPTPRRWNCRSPLPAQKVTVKITPLGARYFQLLRDGHSEEQAIAIATDEHGPAAIPRPHSPRGDE